VAADSVPFGIVCDEVSLSDKAKDINQKNKKGQFFENGSISWEKRGDDWYYHCNQISPFQSREEFTEKQQKELSALCEKIA
jgi:hypothetical protein